MEEKQELNNILLDKSENNSGGSKKYLLIGAGLVLLFLIVLAIMKAINSDTTETQELLPPEPITMEPKEDNKLFEQVPIKSEESTQDAKDKEFEKIVQDIREKTKIATQEEPQQVVDIPENTIIEEKQEVEKPVEKEKPKQSVTEQKGYYIQVGAFYNLKPDQTLLNHIKSKGFEYVVYKTQVNGKDIVKVLIGPYETRNGAKKDLPKVREQVQKGAYLFKI